MHTFFRASLLPVLALLFSACENTQSLKTVDGHRVSLPACKAAISYQGSKWAVRGASYQGVQVGNVEWERTFRDAKPLIEVLDKQEVQHCHSMQTVVSVSTLDEVKKELAARAAASAKLDQLALIIAAQDAKALDRFITTYFMPVSNTFYEEQKDAPKLAVAKTEDSDQAFKLRNIDARPASAIFTR